MGKITKIEVQKRNKKRSNIFIDDEYAFSLSNDIVINERLKVKDIIDEEKLKRVSKEDSFLKCRESAFRTLERSSKTEKELIEKLKTKGYLDEEINRTIEYLKEYKFIDNYSYAERYINEKIKSQGVRKIKYALIQKGVEEDIIEEVIDNVNNDKEEETAKLLCEKKYNQIIKREEDKYKIKNKLFTYLMSKGFDYSIIQRVINNIMEE